MTIAVICAWAARSGLFVHASKCNLSLPGKYVGCLSMFYQPAFKYKQSASNEGRGS